MKTEIEPISEENAETLKPLTQKERGKIISFLAERNVGPESKAAYKTCLTRWSDMHLRISSEQERHTDALKAEALAKGDYEGYLALFHKSELFWAFRKIERRLTNEKYWDLLALCWSMTELVRNEAVWWKLRFSSPRPKVGEFCERSARELAKLDERVVVYRGFSKLPAAKTKDYLGLSWSLSRKTAKFFAKRFAVESSEPHLLSATVNKSDILFYLDDREEEEVIVFPEHLTAIHDI